MQSLIIFLVLLSTYCYCDEHLLGGWSKSNDAVRDQECLKKGLVHINGAEVGDDMQSQVSGLACRTQIVNGLNIKCDFVLRELHWQCSYYKSFVQQLDIQLEECKKIPEEDDDGQVVEKSQILNGNEDDDEEKIDEMREQVGEQNTNNEEDDDEAKIDAMSKQLSEQDEKEEEQQQQ
jgi:hypothetical protein